MGIGSANVPNFNNSRVLSPSNDPSYSENLALYLTSTQGLWIANLNGGNIKLSATVPASVSAFTLSLTNYNTWNSQYEVFTTYGFGYLGKDEPMPNETLLEVDTSSSTDAGTLASSLSQEFALTFVPFTQLDNSTTFAFISPMNFVTEDHVYFWSLLPATEGGFANMTTESTFESQSFMFFKVSYSSSSSYSISYGGIDPLSSASSFSLYTQLGVSTLNYSSSSTSSGFDVDVLGGFVTNTTSPFVNNYGTFSATLAESKTGSNLTVPNVNGSLDFSFPTIIAYRRVTPLDPKIGSNATVSITVSNVSPSGSPSANVSFSDNWYINYGSNLTEYDNSSARYTLAAGSSNTTIYYVKPTDNNSAGLYALPATPVTYTFQVANHTISATALLNTETMIVGNSSLSIASDAAIESWESLNSTSSTLSAGTPLSLTVFVTNYGPSSASDVMVPGQAPFDIPYSGTPVTMNFTVTSSSSSLTNTNATVAYSVSWTDGAGSHSENTNQMEAVYTFGTPGSPAPTLSKTISVSSNKTIANVTLSLFNGGSFSLKNLNITDPIPVGINFNSSIGNTTVTYSNGAARAVVANISAGDIVNYTYSVKITNLNENYVFLPANVSINWNGLMVVHYSQGAGVALGVSASEEVSPNTGFEGATVADHLGVYNNGTLPIYDVSFANTKDPFLGYLNSSTSVTAMLSSGQTVNTTLSVNMTFTPGVYNSSASSANFVFAGANQTVSTNVFTITIYQDILASMNALGPKIEENHNINISITFDNPSNATVSNVKYVLALPANLKLVSGVLSYNIPTLGPNQSETKYIAVSAAIPYHYTIAGGNLTFQYQGKTLKGVTSPLTLNIVDDLIVRYGIPVFVGLVLVLATLLYVRRLVRKPPT